MKVKKKGSKYKNIILKMTNIFFIADTRFWYTNILNFTPISFEELKNDL